MLLHQRCENCRIGPIASICHPRQGKYMTKHPSQYKSGLSLFLFGIYFSKFCQISAKNSAQTYVVNQFSMQMENFLYQISIHIFSLIRAHRIIPLNFYLKNGIKVRIMIDLAIMQLYIDMLEFFLQILHLLIVYTL